MINILPIGGDRPLFNTALMLASLTASLNDLAVESVRYMATYPAQRSGSRYRRTGTLKRSWSFERRDTPLRLERVIGSNSGIAPYNRDVEGDEQTALFHQLGWQNTGDLRRQLQAKAAIVMAAAVRAGL